MKRILLLINFCLMMAISANAQCTLKNTAFTGGEVLTYNLYFNWQFIWVKAGTATMSVSNSTYKGKSAYKASLTTKGNSKADKLFLLRDTLLCYTGQDLTPLYFRKGAREGKRYTVDEVWYNYSGGHTNLTQHFLNKDGKLLKTSKSFSECVVDMMSMFLRSRNLDGSGWSKGHEEKFKLVDGDGYDQSKLVYRGKTSVKGDDNKKYNCIEMSFMILKDGKWKEICRFFVTDDSNHVPVRLDMNLNFGTAKAYLTSMKGVK